uniref:Uncharacterized protein n=1 Tax=Oryzias sinensis TaxID=183150 RepID=A0A8C7WPN7_9TELE
MEFFSLSVGCSLLTCGLCLAAKPISLVERCWCRSTLNTVPQRSIKELKFLHTPNCPFQGKISPNETKHPFWCLCGRRR